ncbi:Polysaccharide biosynthesis C-terminal domain-containing protein [Chitinophaga ginsengisegetis]|uniref:Polysaccharide biosynthesis C-terminal domain-containing protein n=1 Tax=Chitinophaga ginsengisegetis TaxID=393003 RepID=A0A1T5P983_9BACT|nr:flippase [Chitinophaga ginsengisegetis]SKD09281.1 Polysaccharide biosynthesis C-terminal domain-containing protein [Chitinophaga ginsengisegetis]
MHKLFENSGWLLIDKLSKLFPGIIIMALIARHLGPEEFGIWNYALALTTIIGSVAILGMDKLAVKELINNEQKQGTIVATVILMRIVAGALCMAVSTGIVLLTEKHRQLYLYCTIFSALIILLQSFDVLDYFYQVKNNVKRVIIPKVAVFLAFCGIKLLIIYFDGTLITFLWASVIELVVTYFIIVVVYISGNTHVFTWRIDTALAQTLLVQSWPLMLSNLVVVLFMKIDLVLLETLANPAELGKYVGAARISELWYAIPTVISVAILPGLIQKKKISRQAYLLMLEKWLRLSFWLSIAIALVVTSTAHIIIPFLYGPGYVAASWMLMIHIWAGIPVFLSIVMVQYLFVEGEYKIYLYGNLSGLVVNAGINFFLIPLYGGTGAAIATVAAYTTVYGMLLLLDKSGQGYLLTQKMFHPLLVFSDIKQVYNSLRIFTTNLVTLNQKHYTK